MSIHVLQVNQIGSVTESIQAALDSKAAGWGVMVSHRSGETEDTFIADLSVGLASGQVVRHAYVLVCIALSNQPLNIDALSSVVMFANRYRLCRDFFHISAFFKVL